MVKYNILTIFTLFCIVVVIVVSFYYGLAIESQGKDTLDFCKSHYRNETFLDTVYFNGDDSAIPLQCMNESNREKRMECINIESTPEQARFRSCHWLGADYFIIAFTIFFKYILPMMFLLTFGSIILKECGEKEYDKRNT